MDDEEAFANHFHFYATASEHASAGLSVAERAERQRKEDERLKAHVRAKCKTEARAAEEYDGFLVAAATGMVLGGIFGDHNG